MARIKRAVAAKKKRRTVMHRAKGYYGAASRTYKHAKEQVQHSLQYQYRDRRNKKREIRRLSCWERIRTNYLQRDRKVEYRYTYTLKSFTSDEELLRMYATRPDAFSEEEFFRVAELMPSLAEKIEAYRKLLAYYPASEVGKNNLTVLEHEWQMTNSRKGGVK